MNSPGHSTENNGYRIQGLQTINEKGKSIDAPSTDGGGYQYQGINRNNQ